MKIHRIILDVFLALIWCMLNDNFSPMTFAVGFLLGWLSLTLFRTLSQYAAFRLNPWEAVKLLGVFFYEMIKANFQIAFIILSPRLKICPGIIEYPLDLKNEDLIVTLANMISLTPGTLTVDISADRRHIYVHAMVMDTPEKLKMKIKNTFERRLQKMVGEDKGDEKQ